MNETSEENSIKDERKNSIIKKKYLNNKYYTPAKYLNNRQNNLINDLIFEKKEKTYNKSNKFLCLSFNRFRSNEIRNNNRLFIIQKNKNLNNENISNGETNENEDNKLKNNYDLIRKKLLLISKKEKRNINKEKNNIYKITRKLQTSTNIYDLDNKEKINEYKEYRNKINEFEKRKTNKAKTINLKIFENLPKMKNTKYNKNKNSENYEDYNSSRNQRKSFSNYFKTENNNDKSNNTRQYHFPSLNFSKIPKTERHDIYYIENKNNLNNSFNSTKVKKSNNNIIKKKYSLPKKALNLMGKKYQNIENNINIKKSQFSNFANIKRKKSFNNDINKSNLSNLFPNKIFKTYKLYDKNNKFLKQLKKSLKNEYSNNYFENLKIEKEKEISSCFDFIENKINNWTSELPLNNFDKDQNIVFNGEENKKYKRKDKKNIKLILKDFIKTILSIKGISYFYFSFHKGSIEQNILMFLQNKYFDFSLPSYIFEYKYNKLYLNKILKKDKKTLIKLKTLENKKMNNNSVKKTRRNSSLEQIRKRSFINNILLPLNDTEKKSILYLYYLDIDLDNINNSDNLENDEKNSFLKILRGNINCTETQDLLINKFISIYVKNYGTKNKTLSYNKKNSIKANNNTLINKPSNESIRSNEISLFKNNFFSRNEIKRSTSKMERIKKKKSVLEYNLLFDPNLTGYNNLITDTDIIFEPNTERTIIQKRKIKELQELKNKQLNTFFISSGGMRTDKNIIVMKTLDLKNQYNHKNKGNINSLTSSIKDCNYDSFVKFYRSCNCGPNAIDKDGNSLLSLAVKSSCLEIVDFLLEEKANPNLQNVSIFIKINFYFL